MHFEHRNEPLLPREQWLGRVFYSIKMVLLIVAVALAFGILGYHFLGKLGWLDALLEASMILSGMGPVAPMTNDAVKLFASCYALMSGFIVLGSSGILLAPWLHRLMHHFHIEKAAAKKS